MTSCCVPSAIIPLHLISPQASGLALPGSDLDVVILGANGVQLSRPAQGYRDGEKHTIKGMLQRLISGLRSAGLVRRAQLIGARVPIIKAEVKVNGACALVYLIILPGCSVSLVRCSEFCIAGGALGCMVLIGWLRC